MFGTIDPISLAELITKGGEWIAQVYEKRKNKKEQLAAHILYDVTVMTAALRALDNSTN